MALVTETNQQYYQGAQGFRGDAGNTTNQRQRVRFLGGGSKLEYRIPREPGNSDSRTRRQSSQEP